MWVVTKIGFHCTPKIQCIAEYNISVYLKMESDCQNRKYQTRRIFVDLVAFFSPILAQLYARCSSFVVTKYEKKEKTKRKYLLFIDCSVYLRMRCVARI